jgi:hypothetical protein
LKQQATIDTLRVILGSSSCELCQAFPKPPDLCEFTTKP